jgi:hypothetical protein
VANVAQRESDDKINDKPKDPGLDPSTGKLFNNDRSKNAHITPSPVFFTLD